MLRKFWRKTASFSERREIVIFIKRVYEPSKREDGTRFLVDHLWPRGLKKDEVNVAVWLKEVSPSTALRKWFNHDPAKWKEFQRRYFSELKTKPEAWKPLLESAREGGVALVFSARDPEHNNAVAFKSFLEKKLAAKPRKRTKAGGQSKTSSN